MTELHNNTNNTSFDWLERNNNNNYSTEDHRYQQQQQQQLPPINQMSSSSAVNAAAAAAAVVSTSTNTENNNNNLNFQPLSTSSHNLLDDESRRSLSTPYGASSSSSSSWMNHPHNHHPTATTTTATTTTGYSPRDSCDLSYDGDEYHHNHGQPTPSPSASTERSRSKKHRTPSTRDIHVEKNTEGKPPYSYATLIKYAIENSLRKKLTLSEIYQWVIDHYPYYGSAGTGWKNSIRHNLSLNKSFVRVPRPINEPGKGSYWQVDYRAAEAELRSKTTMAVRGRANRSGSDPVGNPYRPDSSWASISNSSSNPSFPSQRFNRDSRSMSLDSNMNTKTFTGSSSSTTAAAAAAAAAAANMNYNTSSYYSSGGYGYTNGNRHHSLSNRHSAEFPRSSSSYMGYDMYNNNNNSNSNNNNNNNGATTSDIQGQTHHYHGRMHPNIMYENSHHHPHHPHHSHHQHQPPYGHMYSSGYTSYGTTPTPAIEEKEQEGHSFSTPQPHFRRIPTSSSPTLTTNNSTSPSPPQPEGKRTIPKKTCAVGNNNEYDWIA